MAFWSGALSPASMQLIQELLCLVLPREPTYMCGLNLVKLVKQTLLWCRTKILPISDIFKQIINICTNSKTIYPQTECSFFSGYLNIIRHHLCKGDPLVVRGQTIPAISGDITRKNTEIPNESKVTCKIILLEITLIRFLIF